MNILFLSYWNTHDPLTTATVLPHLEILSGLQEVQHIYWVNIEREAVSTEIKPPSKVRHIPYASHSRTWGGLGQVMDFLWAPRFLKKLAQKEQVSFIIARGSPSGALVLGLGIPFMVESFEPHADYMRYSGTWKEGGLKYRFQKKWEEEQKRKALVLAPVSQAYMQQLLSEGVEKERLALIPCEVDAEKFRHDEQARQQLREQWGWKHCVVGVYAGKFGGLYKEDEAFRLFAQACAVFGTNFRLLLLSAQDISYVRAMCQRWKVPEEQLMHLKVPFEKMPAYLSAADFAFALYKNTPIASALSPVKVGEYWAMGLPVLIGEGIGDDSDILKKTGMGVVYHPSTYKEAVEQMRDLLARPNQEAIRHLALIYRNSSFVREAYRLAFSKLQAVPEK